MPAGRRFDSDLSGTIKGVIIVALNERQLRFVEAMLVAETSTAAAIAAGYDQKRARITASELLARQDIQDAIARLRAERAERTGITADWVVQQLQAEAGKTGEGSSHGARIRALELLGKHVGMWPTKVEVTGKDGGPIEVSDATADARLAAIVARFAVPGPDAGDRGDGPAPGR